MLKSRLQKLDGLTHSELKRNITNTIKQIPKEKYKNIIKVAYERPEKYVSKKNKRHISWHHKYLLRSSNLVNGHPNN